MTASASTAASALDQLLSEWLAGEVLQHLPLVQAAVATIPSETAESAVNYPQSWKEVGIILKKLAYTPSASDCWSKLGMSA